jgi:hypothetical protein
MVDENGKGSERGLLGEDFLVSAPKHTALKRTSEIKGA